METEIEEPRRPIPDLETNRSICPLPWMHFSVNLDTSIRVCCNTDHGGFVRRENGERVFLPEIGSVDDYYNLPSMKGLRKSMMDDRRPAFCNNCYKVEDSGGVSLRQIYVRQFEKKFEKVLARTQADGQTVPDIRFLDFSLSNQCNLKCRMCNPVPSESLRRDFEEEGLFFDRAATDRARDGWGITPEFMSLVESQLRTAEEMLTTGGEPFLSPQHRYILQRAVDLGRAGEIILRYHTNLTTLPDELVKLWAHFKRIDVHISLEGHGPVAEYVRYPSRWKKIEANLERLLTLSQALPIHAEIHTCFQAYNLLTLADFLEFIQKYEGRLPTMPYLIWLDNPSHLAAAVLPLEIRAEAIRRLEGFLARHETRLRSGHAPGFHGLALDNLRSHIRLLQTLPFDAARFREFVGYTRTLDRRRQQDFLVLCPEMKESFAAYGPAGS